MNLSFRWQLVACLATMAAVGGISACLPERANAVLPPVTVRHVMVGTTIPASTAIFNAAGEAPRDDAGWDELRRHAVALGESGNRLTVGARGPERDEWIRLARAMADGASRVARAAAARDADAVAAAGDAIYAACEGCHKRFMTAPEPLRPGTTAS